MMDYAARLSGLGQPQPPAGGATQRWKPPGVSGQGMAGFQLSAEGAMVTPEQQSILDAIVGVFNSAGRAS